MTAPLLWELRNRRPDLRLTIQCSLPEEWLRSRLPEPFDLVGDTPDFGARMRDGVTIDRDRTLADYRDLHHRLPAVIQAEAERLARLRPDAVLSNISYIALAAARRAGVPGIGMSVFTWSDILADLPEAADIVAAMRACYGQADMILRTTPGMKMAGLGNVRTIGPIAERHPSRRDAVRQRLGAGQGERVGLIGFGGFGLPLPLERWPRLGGWRWLTPEPVPARPDLTLWSDLGLPFSTLLASADVIVTKPGYGTFAECAVAGTPVLTVPRPDWPEAPVLIDWLSEMGRCRIIPVDGLFDGRLEHQLQELFSLPTKPLVEPSGIAEAVEAVLGVLPSPPPQHRA